ncbi:MAG: HEAT repeat domain-containing protein [Elusimicrobia bacterium]|nr:HEAT repeat domain-containing protein [Elusimicrobiota bacterium]
MGFPNYFSGIILVFLISACSTGRPTLPVLVKQMRHSDPAVRVRAMGHLPSYGADGVVAVPLLVENFRNRQEPVHRSAERAFVALGVPGAHALSGLLSDTDSWVRCRAASALIPMGASAEIAVPALVEALRDRDFCVSEKAVLALGAIGEPAVPSLLEALKSTNAMARKGASAALGLMNEAVHAQVAGTLLPSLLSSDEFIRGEAAMRITHMGKIGVPVFLKALKEKDVDLRQRAVDGLGEIGLPRPDVVDALITLFKDSQRTLRLKASVVLGQLGQKDDAVYKTVASLLVSKDKEILLGTLRALGNMGGVAEPSIPQFVFFLEESKDPDLRNEAAESLIRMGTAASMSAAERYTRGHYRRPSINE